MTDSLYRPLRKFDLKLLWGIIKKSALCMLPILVLLVFYFFMVHIRCAFDMRYKFPANFWFVPLIDHIIKGDVIRFIAMYPENGFLTVVAVIPYFIHYVFPFAFVIYMVAIHKEMVAFKYGVILSITSMIILLFQLLFPTAPPWMSDLQMNSTLLSSLECHGMYGTLPVDPSIKGKYAARFSYFHDKLNFDGIQNIFTKNKSLFGAFPSMHIVWAISSLFADPQPINRKCLYITHFVWLSWAILYSNHHYFVDIVASVLLVWLVDFTFNLIYHRKRKSEKQSIRTYP